MCGETALQVCPFDCILFSILSRIVSLLNVCRLPKEGALKGELCIVHVLKNTRDAQALRGEERSLGFDAIEFGLSVHVGAGVVGGTDNDDRSKGALTSSNHPTGQWRGGTITKELYDKALATAADLMKASKQKASIFGKHKALDLLDKNLAAIAAGLYFGVTTASDAGADQLHTQRYNKLLAQIKIQFTPSTDFKDRAAFIS